MLMESWIFDVRETELVYFSPSSGQTAGWTTGGETSNRGNSSLSSPKPPKYFSGPTRLLVFQRG